MTIVEMLEQSVILTVLGMAIVFAFLWLMIVCVSLTGKLIHALGWDKDLEAQKKEAPRGAGKTVTPEVTAAITAAVTEYRERK
ncbi:MAG: OadG family protein [Treponema sp.]|jgi:oxaloacetate decarboxylase gamma subunit|nr:OadG family protein [Treponema sp.]